MSEVMDAGHLNYWCERLLSEPALGWNHDHKALSKALGLRSERALKKILFANGKWNIVQQRRASKQLREILSGDIEMRRVEDDKGRIFWLACRSADPKPLETGPKTGLFVSIRTNGVKLHTRPAPFEPPPTPMPSFRDMLRRL